MMMTGQLVVYCSVAAALRGGPRIAKAPRRRARAKAGAALSADGDAHAITVVDAAAIVGGLGSPVGAIAGGFVIAFSEVTITYAWKKVLGYVMPEGLQPDGLVQLMSTDYKFAVSFVILLIVLLIKPTGLFTKGVR